MSQEKKRVNLSLEQKFDIIAACNGPRKESFACIAKQYGIDPSTVSKIYKSKENFISNAGLLNSKRKRR